MATDLHTIRLITIIALVYTVAGFHRAEYRRLCHYPCNCPVRELNCGSGVAIIKDGCDCCYMCARQHGDLCNVKDRCDSNQGLYCDRTSNHAPMNGVCRAKLSKPCVVDNKTYADGEKFKPECSRLCTCQNGNYGCVDLCPDEHRVPSKTHCKYPQLLSVSGQCCKQWTCNQHDQRMETTSGISPRHLFKSKKRHMEMRMRSSSITTGQAVSGPYQNIEPLCTTKASDWTHCSRDCDIGLSTRTVEHINCEKVKETRLCYIRPCNTTVAPRNKQKCTPTTRTRTRERVKYEDCVSIKQLNFKFCTNCKRSRCCYPRREKTRDIEFQCGDGRRQKFSFMWIKSCRCDRQCYKAETAEEYWKGS